MDWRLRPSFRSPDRLERLLPLLALLRHADRAESNEKDACERDEGSRTVRAQSAARIAELRARIDKMHLMKQVANVSLYFAYVSNLM
jgi:hypothetical protein